MRVVRRNGSTATARISRCRLSPPLKRQRARRHFSRRRRPSGFPADHGLDNAAFWLVALRLLFDGQPLPPSRRNARAKPFARHATFERPLHATLQSAARTRWTPISGTLQSHSGGTRKLLARAGALYRSKSGASGLRVVPGGLALVVIQGQRRLRTSATLAVQRANPRTFWRG